MKEIIKRKPKQKRALEKYEAILDASTRVLAEYGFKKTTTAKIALEADVSSGTLYDYFPNKESIFICYLDKELNKALEDVANKASQPTADEKELLKELLRIGIDFAFAHKEMLKVIFTEMPDMIHDIGLESSAQRIHEIAFTFANNRAIDIAGHDINLLLYTLTNIVLGFQLRVVLLPDDSIKREDAINELFNAISRYIGFA